MSHITRNLYLGTYFDSVNEAFLFSKDIKMIITLAKECKQSAPTPNIDVVRHFIGITSKKADDLTPRAFEAVYQIIKGAESNNTNVLVHCVNGRHRSASFVLYYLMRELNLTADKAYVVLKKARPCVDISVEFANKVVVAINLNCSNTRDRNDSRDQTAQKDSIAR